jgi:hypothetical protein
MRAPTYSIEVMEVTGNVTDYTVHMCTIQGICRSILGSFSSCETFVNAMRLNKPS